MRWLVLSDIHANAAALASSLEACKAQWDKAVCLGDVVGYGPDPNEVIFGLRGMLHAIIRGNHDKAACGIGDIEQFNAVARCAVEWTRRELRPDNLEFLSALRAGPLPVENMTLVHGAYEDEDQYVFAAEQALECLRAAPGNLTLFGHTHMQGGFALRNSVLETISVKIPPGASGTVDLAIEPGSRYLINPGSVGQPRDGDARAAFAIVDTDRSVVQFWRVAYDIRSVQARMRWGGLPESLIQRLAAGH